MVHAPPRADLERVVDALAAHGAVTTSLVLSSPVNKTVTVHAAGFLGVRLEQMGFNLTPLD